MPADAREERESGEPGSVPVGDSASLNLATHRDRDRMHLAVLLVAAGLAAYLLFRLLAPFTLALVTSGVTAVLARGAYRSVRGRVGNQSLAALLVTVFVFLLVVVPLVGLLALVVRDLQSGISLLAEPVEDFADQEGEAWQTFETVAGWIGMEATSLLEAIQDLSLIHISEPTRPY